MKSTPLSASESTAFVASSAVAIGIDARDRAAGPSSIGPATIMRGPTIWWAATSLRARSTSSSRLPMSRMPVIPFATNSGST